jgi:hypothetical protein
VDSTQRSTNYRCPNPPRAATCRGGARRLRASAANKSSCEHAEDTWDLQIRKPPKDELSCSSFVEVLTARAKGTRSFRCGERWIEIFLRTQHSLASRRGSSRESFFNHVYYERYAGFAGPLDSVGRAEFTRFVSTKIDTSAERISRDIYFWIGFCYACARLKAWPFTDCGRKTHYTEKCHNGWRQPLAFFETVRTSMSP